MGSETTGQRAAIIYTMVECAKRHGHNPEVYLADEIAGVGPSKLHFLLIDLFGTSSFKVAI